MAFNPGQPRGRANAHQYEPLACAIIINACHEFEVRIATINAYPGDASKKQWGEESLENAMKKAGMQFSYTAHALALVRFFSTDVHGLIYI
jgi:hypothetical protein